MISNRQSSNIIRTIVRSVYDMQDLRIKMGNRIVGNFKAKMGLTQDGMSEEQMEQEDKTFLEKLRIDYRRITDPIAAIIRDNKKSPKATREKKEAALAASNVTKLPISDIDADDVEPVDKLPKEKDFIPGEIISSYTEMKLVHQYLLFLVAEKAHFKDLEDALQKVPIYTEFLQHIDGIGPAMAGVIVSEIDIHIPTYVSSIWKYAGMDVVVVGSYTDNAGKKVYVPAIKLRDSLDPDSLRLLVTSPEPNKVMGEQVLTTADGHKITLENVGRSRKAHSLEKRTYINKDGQEAVRDSISYNPFLKTKLLGVLGTSFLRCGSTTVNGVRMGAPKRKQFAIDHGFVAVRKKKDEPSPGTTDQQVTQWLKDNGYKVEELRGEYGVYYYNYKNRIRTSPRHDDKTDAHVHKMAIRYMVKRFLKDLYVKWKTLENLPVHPEYSEGKQGIIHNKIAA
jgi:hypothetical protein